MSFYNANVTHPIVTVPVEEIEEPAPEVFVEYSGTATATATSAQVTAEDEPASSGVWLKNEDADEGVRVLAEGEANGFLLSPNTSRFFPVDNVNKLWIQRAGTADVVVSYHAS